MPKPPIDADVWIFDDNSIRYDLCYTKESIRHPAKMELNMCREIIKRYTKKGDLVLDCMAGIGTTIIEGMILGRNVIGVEYEQKFVDMAQANIDKTMKNCSFFKDCGKGTIVKGDSRELVKVLDGVWAENNIFSPPFASVTMEKPASDKWKGPDFTQQVYSSNKEDKSQIGNLRYADNGVVNAIVTSPPFSNSLGTNRGGKGTSTYQQTGFANTEHYSSNPNDKVQIANLRYTDDGIVNSIITSPPFANANPCQDVEKAEIQKQKWEKNNVKGGSGFLNKVYSEEKDNIGNMPYKADSIITSPPYSHPSYHIKEHDTKPSPWLARMQKEGGAPGDMFSAENYSDDQNNCGNYSGQTYLDAMLVIYKQCFLVLKNGGHMILVTKNFTRAGKEVRLDLDTIKLCEAAGFTYITRHYRKLNNVSFWIRNALIKWNKKHPNEEPPYPMYEDVLVFSKGQQ